MSFGQSRLHVAGAPVTTVPVSVLLLSAVCDSPVVLVTEALFVIKVPAAVPLLT
jgi:hypothetical protein